MTGYLEKAARNTREGANPERLAWPDSPNHHNQGSDVVRLLIPTVLLLFAIWALLQRRIQFPYSGFGLSDFALWKNRIEDARARRFFLDGRN
jgi:hypothetical protein